MATNPGNTNAAQEANEAESRNLLTLVAHTVALRCGWIFKTEAVVMPAVVDLLAGPVGASGWIRGFLPLLNKLGQSLPPLFSADLVRRRPLKKWPLVVTSLTMAFVFAAIAGLWAVRLWIPSSWAIVAFLALYTVFFASVGLTGLSYNTVQGKLIRPQRRGRLLGIGSVVGSLAAVGLAWLLMPGWLAWPNASGFVPIFLASASGYAVAAVMAGCLIETPTSSEDRPRARPFRDAVRLLKTDRWFRRTAIVAALSATSQILFPHYQWVGREFLGADLGSLFWWVLAQNMTVAVVGPFAGVIGDRFGNRLALRLMITLSLLPPIVAAVLMWLSRSGVETAGNWFWVVFCLLGLTPVTVKTLMNYTLELTEPENHPAYVASMQTCFAVPFLLSPIAGLLVDATADRLLGMTYLIGIVVALIVIALGLTFRLVEMRHAGKDRPGD